MCLQSKSLDEVLLWLVSPEASVMYPSLSLAGAVALTAPVQTADVERLFSALKLVNRNNIIIWIEITCNQLYSIYATSQNNKGLLIWFVYSTIIAFSITFSTSENTTEEPPQGRPPWCVLQGGHRGTRRWWHRLSWPCQILLLGQQKAEGEMFTSWMWPLQLTASP